VWLPLQPSYTRLLAAIAQPLLRLIDKPPLISSLVARDNSIALYSFLTGFGQPMASWSTETMGVFVLAPLVLVLAAPLPRLPDRLVAALLVLGLVIAVSAGIAVTQIKLVVETHATEQLGITLHTATERAILERFNLLHVVGMLALPALLFAATYAWGLWVLPSLAMARRRRGHLFAGLAVGALALAAWGALAAVPEPSTARGDYHEGWARVLRLNPGFAPAQINVALHLEATDRLDEAVELYRAALSSRPDLPEAHYNLGNALLKLKRHDDAAERFRSVLRLDPAHAGAHRNLGLALARSSRPCEAVEQLELSTQLDPRAATNSQLVKEIGRLRGLCRSTDPGDSREAGR
jgi:hypothetical protein